MKIVVLHRTLNISIQFAGYHTGTQYKTECKTRRCAQSGVNFVLLLWLPFFELSCRLHNLYSLLKTLKYAFIYSDKNAILHQMVIPLFSWLVSRG
jgi:hypothetical protein